MAQLWAERLGMPCNAEHAKNLSRQYVCICISQRLISHWVMKQVWTDWQFQILLQRPHTPVQPNIS